MHTHTGHVELFAVANHSHNNGHEMHWTPRVLAREEDTTKRKIKEALAIKKVTNGRRDGVINNQDSAMKISKLWLDLVKKKKIIIIFFRETNSLDFIEW